MPKAAHRGLRLAALPAALILLLLPAWAAEKPRLEVNDYQIDAELVPAAHRLKAHAVVKFTALEDLNVAVFELHNALHPTRIVDTSGHSLNFERISQDSVIRVPLTAALPRGSSSSLTFDYEGLLESGDDSPVPGLKLAYISEDESYLLYAGRWFPMSGYNTNRFTSTIRVTVPAGLTVIGSGQAAAPQSSASHSVYTFASTRLGFPGTLIAGKFASEHSDPGGVDLTVYFKPNHKELISAYAETAGREFQYFSLLYGGAPAPVLKVVELPGDTVPNAWAPEIAALNSQSVTPKTNYRLLADTIAHQWFGDEVSPASKPDFWITEGGARYSEVRYVQQVAGEAGLEEGVKDVSVGALAYDNTPLSQVSKLDAFSPEFQSLVTDKGAMIYHMLRWELGEAAFDKTMRAFIKQYGAKPATTDDLREVAEQQSGQKLSGFFTQWLDSTGAPEFKDKYTVYRTAKGFRVVGEITQDLDLFRMPVELKIDTDGPSETKRIDVAGTDSAYTVETFGKPRRITIDPNNWVLKNSPDLKLRTAIHRGTQLVQEGDLAAALLQFKNALDISHSSSLAHFRIAEVYFLQHNYQSAANEYRESLNGDGDPRWTEVWSHIQLGKIYDLTGQRERATNEYRQALNTNDNTQGAQDEARKYLSAPYQQERPRNGG
ncbi:MAG: peptidase M1 [Acidobacteria bacterium]|nr:peptidase M1 [Acidobacteriota bacterium]